MVHGHLALWRFKECSLRVWVLSACGLAPAETGSRLVLRRVELDLDAISLWPIRLPALCWTARARIRSFRTLVLTSKTCPVPKDLSSASFFYFYLRCGYLCGCSCICSHFVELSWNVLCCIRLLKVSRHQMRWINPDSQQFSLWIYCSALTSVVFIGLGGEAVCTITGDMIDGMLRLFSEKIISIWQIDPLCKG